MARATALIAGKKAVSTESSSDRGNVEISKVFTLQVKRFHTLRSDKNLHQRGTGFGDSQKIPTRPERKAENTEEEVEPKRDKLEQSTCEQCGPRRARRTYDSESDSRKDACEKTSLNAVQYEPVDEPIGPINM